LRHEEYISHVLSLRLGVKASCEQQHCSRSCRWRSAFHSCLEDTYRPNHFNKSGRFDTYK